MLNLDEHQSYLSIRVRAIDVKPSISVIIPFKDEEETIQRAILSVQRQTLKPKEIILIDSDSQDQSRNLVMDMKRESKVPILVTSSPAKGVAAARNFGVTFSSGDIIAFLDADDVWVESKLKTQAMLHKNNPNVLSGTFAKYINPHGRVVGNSPQFGSFFDMFVFAYKDLEVPFVLSSWMITREKFFEIGQFDEKLMAASDYEFFFRALRKGIQIECVPHFLTNYSLSKNSITHRNRSLQLNHSEHTAKNYLALTRMPDKTQQVFFGRFSMHEKSKYLLRLALIESRSAVDPKSAFLVLAAFLLNPKLVLSRIIRQRK